MLEIFAFPFRGQWLATWRRYDVAGLGPTEPDAIVALEEEIVWQAMLEATARTLRMRRPHPPSQFACDLVAWAISFGIEPAAVAGAASPALFPADRVHRMRAAIAKLLLEEGAAGTLVLSCERPLAEDLAVWERLHAEAHPAPLLVPRAGEETAEFAGRAVAAGVPSWVVPR